MKTLIITNELKETEKVKEFLKKSLQGKHISEEEFYKIELAVHEICVNIIRYAYPDRKGEIQLFVWEKDNKIYFKLVDEGIAFNPMETKKPDINEVIQKGGRGGFGIFISKKFMDDFSYERENGQNRVTMIKKINPSV